MAGGPCSDCFVMSCFRRSPGISGHRLGDAFHVLEYALHPPETPAGERRRCGPGKNLLIQSGRRNPYGFLGGTCWRQPWQSRSTDRKKAERAKRKAGCARGKIAARFQDRKSTRLNSSHVKISYAV